MLFYVVNYNVIWGCIISAIIGAGATVLCFLIMKNKGVKTAEDMKPSDKREILIGLRDNAEVFSELYEPLFLLASGKVSRKDWVFDEWNNAVNSLEGYSTFKKAFAKKFGDVASWKGKKKKYVKNADKLLKYIFKAGIERDDSVTVIGNVDTAEKYDIIGIASIETGAEYDVFVPYWELEIDGEEDKILSKGAIR